MTRVQNINAFLLDVLPASVVVSTFVSADLVQTFYDEFCDEWSYGDVEYSLVGNSAFQSALFRFLREYTESVVTMEDVRKFDDQYWGLVDNCYIALGE
jgi:hypothetical protein